MNNNVKIKIRKGRRGDLKRVVEISKNLKQLENYPNQKLDKSEFEKFIVSKYAFMYVAELENEVVGYITAFRSDEYLFLPFSAVDRKYRRLGIASKLIKKVEEIARKEKRKYILFTAYLNNKPIHSFAKKLGYRASRKLIQYYKLMY